MATLDEMLEGVKGTIKKVTPNIGKYMEAAKKGMDITDGFINTGIKINLINDGTQTQTELQDKVFAAANRSRGDYTDTAGNVSRMGLAVGDSFQSNDQLIAFTELAQKSFQLGGADPAEQQSGMLQLTQAMGSGKFQGDEFDSIIEKAPLIAEAVEAFTKKSGEELKQMAAEGELTADIMKNAMFMAAQNINEQFGTMPMTFADIWSKVKNGALKAFQPIMEGISGLLKSDELMGIVNTVIMGIGLLSMAIGAFFGFISDNWPLIESVLLGIGTYLTATLLPGFIRTGIAGLISGLQAAAGWIAANAPLIMLIGAIALLIYAFIQSGNTARDVFGAIGAFIGAAIAIVWNLFLGLLEYLNGIKQSIENFFITLGNFLANLFVDPISAIIYLFQGLADTVLGFLERIASAMDFVFGTHMADTVSEWRKGLKQMADEAVKGRGHDPKDFNTYTQDFSIGDANLKRLGVGETASKGADIGQGAYDKIADKVTGFKNKLTGEGLSGYDTNQFDTKGYDMSQFGTTSNPLTVEGTGSNGAVNVNMEDENLQYLRDLAERDYINKLSTATLAPNVSISFGDVHQEADADKIAGRIKKILQEEIAVTAEGAY